MTDFPQPALLPIAHLAPLQVDGRDAAAFLQGQITCDVRCADGNRSLPGAICNPEGRVLANFRLLARDNSFLLLLAADLITAMQHHLRRYVLRADVNLTTAPLACLGVQGEPEALPAAAPREADTVAQIGDLTWVRIPDPQPRWLLIGDPAALSRWQRQHESPLASPQSWILADICCGIPWITAATSGRFLPQMLNLDLLGGICFDKGCYTGQEVIARVHYRGQVKRRLYRFFAPGAEPPPPGTAVMEEEENVGEVVNAAPVAEGTELLAVVRRDVAHSSALRLATAPSSRLQRRDLAYTVT